MSNFKFKTGDLVEVIKSANGNKGHRFVIGNFMLINWTEEDGSISEPKCKSYETDLISRDEATKFMWSSEDQLKLVNPDIDDISDSTFSEIMDKITEAITVEQ